MEKVIIKIEVSSISAINENHFPKGFKSKLTEAIDLRKAESIWADRSELDEEEWFYKSSRYLDSGRVAQCIMSNISREMYFDHELNDLMEYAQNLSPEDQEKWIDSSLEYSGHADYYYAFEKEY